MKEKPDFLSGLFMSIGQAIIVGGLLSLLMAVVGHFVPEVAGAETHQLVNFGGGCLFVGGVLVLLARVKPSKTPSTPTEQ